MSDVGLLDGPGD